MNTFIGLRAAPFRQLEGEGLIKSERRPLRTNTTIKLVWHKSYRFHKRSAKALVALVEDYSNPNIGAFLGLHGEGMVLEGFSSGTLNSCDFRMQFTQVKH